MSTNLPPVDVVMLGTFSAWNLGTIQARALPLASALRPLGVNPAIVVTPWDMPSEAGTFDIIDGIPIINTHAVSAKYPIAAVRQQIEWVRKLNPALAHVFKPKGFGGFAGMALNPARPVIVDSDDWEGDGGWNQAAGYGFAQRRVFQLQERTLLQRATYVTAASTLLAERARKLRNGRENSVWKIPNGLTTSRWGELSTARQTPPGSINPPVVLLYSRFAEFENDWLASFVRALYNLAGERLTVRVVGNIEQQSIPTLSDSCVGLDLLGYVVQSSIPTILGTSTIAVYPYRDSLVTRSKQSVKLLEQMAAGCPVIASDVGDIAQTLGTTGVVMAGASPEAFARETVEQLRHPERLNVLSVNAIERVRSNFLFDDLARLLLDIYLSAGLPQ